MAHDAIKRANPNAQVVLGGLSLGGTEGALDEDFFENILADAQYPAAKYFDIANFHHYGTLDEARRRMQYVQGALAKVGAAVKPVSITEVGYGSDRSGQDMRQYQGKEGQAAWLRDMFPALLKLGA